METGGERSGDRALLISTIIGSGDWTCLRRMGRRAVYLALGGQ